jgi:hypothetical protein
VVEVFDEVVGVFEAAVQADAAAGVGPAGGGADGARGSKGMIRLS